MPKIYITKYIYRFLSAFKMDIIERIRIYIDYQGISERKFFQNTGLANGSFSKTRSVGSDNLLKIFSTYPDLNMDWVVTGRGEMIFNENEKCTQCENLKEKYLSILEEQNLYLKQLNELRIQLQSK